MHGTVNAVLLGARSRRLAYSSVTSILLCNVLHAQVLEEIVVTSERREQSLQDVPISVVAFSAEALELRGIETLEDVATFTPNLDLKGSRFSGNNNPTWQVRGLSGGGGTTGERATGFYIDGIYMPRTTGPFLSVLDIERIEVLRGPQGTLFGRNSTGGAIRVFTKRPTLESESYVRLGLGNFERQDVSAMINVPISDQFQLRLTGASLSQDGYVYRGTQALGGQDDVIGRVQLQFLPSDNVSVNVNLSYNDLESDGGAQDLAVWDMLPDLNYQGNYADWVSDFLEAAGQPRLDVYNDPRVVLDDYTMPDWCFIDDGDPDWDPACEQYNNSKYEQFDTTVEWQLGERWTMMSITGLSSFESEAVNDAQLLGFSWAPGGVESDLFYQELQFNGTLRDGGIDLVAGLTYFHEEGSEPDNASLSVIGTSAFPANPGTPPNSWSGLRSTNSVTTEPEADSYGIFFNATVDLTERLSVTPGVRWAFDTKDITQTEYASDNFVPAPGTTSTTIFATEDWDELDWRLTLDYDIGDNHMVYATASKAYRAGAYSLPGGIRDNIPGDQQTATLAVSPPFTPPENVRNNELGFRTEWVDGRVRFNATYFDMVYTDRQSAVAVLDPTAPAGFVIQVQNLGDVDIWGVELEGQFAVTDDFTLDFSSGYVNTRLYDVCANNGDFLFPGPVEESYTLGGRWSKLLSSGSDLTFSLNYAWVGDQNTHPGGTATPCPSPVTTWFFDSRYVNEDYGLLNGRIRFTSGDGRWTGTLYGNNLTDEVYSNMASRAGGGWWDSGNPNAGGGIAAPLRSVVQHVRGRPREYGVTFQYNFGGAAAPSR